MYDRNYCSQKACLATYVQGTAAGNSSIYNLSVGLLRHCRVLRVIVYQRQYVSIQRRQRRCV